ncbi:turtle-like 4 [Homarus americanus]|uniref:Turtle-like 4 n=1 Tax=Homarus americanus TaxID=6706 RepID=A0A8J5JUM8_HOMAM|nr:turtle-like 4 [Homarus americanus]
MDGGAKVVSLVWLLDGVEMDDSWEVADAGVVTNLLEIDGLQHHHHNAHLTCRLTTHAHTHVAANITDVSTTITMFRVLADGCVAADGYVAFDGVIINGYVIADEIIIACDRCVITDRCVMADRCHGRQVCHSQTGVMADGVSPADGCVRSQTGIHLQPNRCHNEAAWGSQVTESETGYLVTEGSDLTFLCTVTAHPPAYNVTWLHNGRVVSEGGRRWRRDDWQLQVSQVRRGDAGLYTCLASNSEGDGHSNALLLQVAHPPQCQDSGEQQVVVAVNTSVTLTCKMDALPAHLTFTWTLADPPTHHQDAHKDLRGGIITGDAPPPHHPGLIDLTPGHPPGVSPSSGPAGDVQDVWGEHLGDGATKGMILEHQVHPHDPRKSSVTLTPTSPAQVFCYARNKVKCHDLAPTESDQQELTQVHHAPGISFVRSSGVRPSTNLEVSTEVTEGNHR